MLADPIPASVSAGIRDPGPKKKAGFWFPDRQNHRVFVPAKHAKSRFPRDKSSPVRVEMWRWVALCAVKQQYTTAASTPLVLCLVLLWSQRSQLTRSLQPSASARVMQRTTFVALVGLAFLADATAARFSDGCQDSACHAVASGTAHADWEVRWPGARSAGRPDAAPLLSTTRSCKLIPSTQGSPRK